jgi:hypothetical protein
MLSPITISPATLSPVTAVELAEQYASQGHHIAAGVLCRVALERHIRRLAKQHGIGQSGRMTAHVVNALVATDALPKPQAVLIRKALGKASKAAHGLDLGHERTMALVAWVRRLTENPRQGELSFAG